MIFFKMKKMREGSNMVKLVFATGNEGKLKEVEKIINSDKFEVISPNNLGEYPDIEETGDTYEENAKIKAETIYNLFKLPTIADDSGLSIDQLNGRPGVKSARYAGENCTFDDNNYKVIKELSEFEEPHTARFVSCAVFYNGKKFISAEGTLEGRIIDEFRGTHGFGYDPIFIPDGYDRTLAELELEQKNKMSHRGKSFKKLAKLFEEYFDV